MVLQSKYHLAVSCERRCAVKHVICTETAVQYILEQLNSKPKAAVTNNIGHEL